MKFIRIINWNTYQHYRDRNPPWIKLHRDLLISETWADANDASRVLAIAIMLLAAATDNKIKFDKKYLKRVAYLNSEPNFDHLLKVGFVEIIDENSDNASKLQADARPETEKRQRHIKKDFKKNKERATKSNGGFYAQSGSLQMDAWDEHNMKAKGKRTPRDKNGGWLQSSEWPPGYEHLAKENV